MDRDNFIAAFDRIWEKIDRTRIRKTEQEKQVTVAQKDNLILDNGGTRSGRDRRRPNAIHQGEEKRLSRNRRRWLDRRSGLSRRTTTDRRYSNNFWDGSRIERRDAFRK